MSHYPREDAQDSLGDLFLGDLGQSEKLSEIKPPLAPLAYKIGHIGRKVGVVSSEIGTQISQITYIKTYILNRQWQLAKKQTKTWNTTQNVKKVY